MRIVRIDKERLLEIIEANKEKYVADLREARAAYLLKAKEELSAALKNVTAFNSVHVLIQAPVDQTAEYNKVIQMLELTTDTVIELTNNEFDQFVNNEWNFVHNLRALSASYSK